jgi:hypothetical protein
MLKLLDLKIISVEPGQFVDLDKWASITIEQWQFNLASKLHISNRKRTKIYEDESLTNLIDSFTYNLAINSNHDEALISFGFNYYFRMLDAGWGAPSREPSKVFTKDLYKNVARLNWLLAEQYALQGAAMFTTVMTDVHVAGQEIRHQAKPNITTERVIQVDTGDITL